MIIEVLLAEFADLFADGVNVEYLSKCLPTAQIIKCPYHNEPYFVKHPVDLIYLGSMSENKQLLALEKLRPYREKLKEMIESDCHFLLTGNALELFGQYILEDQQKIDCLGLLDYYIKRDRHIERRYNSSFLGAYRGMKIIGYKSQFSLCFGDQGKYPFIKVIEGFGNNLTSKNEGYHYHNFYATYLLGPFLLLNPPFLQSLLKELGEGETLYLKEAAYAAYDYRLKQLSTHAAKKGLI